VLLPDPVTPMTTSSGAAEAGSAEFGAGFIENASRVELRDGVKCCSHVIS
jgi:hypothetical protein